MLPTRTPSTPCSSALVTTLVAWLRNRKSQSAPVLSRIAQARCHIGTMTKLLLAETTPYARSQSSVVRTVIRLSEKAVHRRLQTCPRLISDAELDAASIRSQGFLPLRALRYEMPSARWPAKLATQEKSDDTARRFGTLMPREPSPLVTLPTSPTPSRPASFDDNIIGDWFNRRGAQTGPAQ